MTRYGIVLLAFLWALPLGGAPKTVLSSPDGSSKITVSAASGRLQYSISYGGKTLVEPSALGFEFDDGTFGDNVKMGKPETTKVIDEYDLPVGKKSHVLSVSNQAVIPLTDKATGRRIDLYVRAFDDAVAFRYVFPEQQGWETLTIMNERMDIRTAGDPTVTALYLRDGYINSHEGPYSRVSCSSLEENVLIDMPTLFEFPGCNMAVMEANLVDYAGMYLMKKGGVLGSRLSPSLRDWKTSVVADLPHRSPWRVFQLSRRAGALIESTVLTTLADPCKVEDLGWLKPGKTTFPWWNDSVAPDTTFQWGNNFETAKYYIDFAASSGLEYHSVYGYADMPWYIDDGPGFGLAGPNADLTRHDPRLDFPRVCSYARSKGVDIHVWLNWAALYKDIDRVFDKFNEWGVKGMMVDFMNRDDQEMIRIQEDILRKAADHHLFIQFHGASKPSGLVRTYPNEFTREGTLNYEVYKWDTGRSMGADHDINMPFTRLLAGPADYHLGGFRSVPMDKYECTYHAPVVTSTRCHMLGMYIVMESYLAMVCDYPDAYRGQPGFDFLCSIPTNWDDTVVPAAEIAEYCVVARRHGDDWFVGAINNSEPRAVEIPTDFLGSGKFMVRACFDADDTDEEPNHLVEEEFEMEGGKTLEIRLAGAGGCALKISRCLK
ncbi:MAG: glycoside hydrolase family 97 protein [Bacteroidales bacterium]|nr:glycoside hydrolase family 97 protein [Bacteroidales bacterium]